MTLPYVLDVMELLDGWVTGEQVAEYLGTFGVEATIQPVEGPTGRTEFISILIPGTAGRAVGGATRTTGVVGRLGGVGARPAVTGLVSDADGAAAAISCAAKLGRMRQRGDALAGDVRISTHVCPDAPTEPHDPVPFMGSPVPIATMNAHEVHDEMDVVLSIDTSKGNRLVNHKGIAVTLPVMQGWIAPITPEMLDIMQVVTGAAPVVMPLSTYDITPYGNALPHVNSIVQPAVVTGAPVVGVAVTSAVVVPGCASGASHPTDVALAATFCIEVAKAMGSPQFDVLDRDAWHRAVQLYGPMHVLQPAEVGSEA
jgi:hypothetical protein